MLVEVNVTKEHIARGLRKQVCACPIACAINELIADDYIAATSAHTGVEDCFTWGLANNDNLQNWPISGLPLSKVVTTFIRSFDDGEKCFPLTFEIEIPDKYLKG